MDAKRATGLVQCQFVRRYALNAIVVLWGADLLQTMPMEVEVIWGSPWNLVKVLFYVNRYMPLDVILDFPYAWGDNSTVMCQVLYSICSAAYHVGITFAEAMMFLRVYALSGCNPIFKIWLMFQFFVAHIVSVSFLVMFIKAVKYGPSPIASFIPCFPIRGQIQWAVICFSTFIASEFLLLVYTVYFGYKKHRESRGHLVTILYRDGLLYFLAFFVCTVVNIAVILELEPACKTFLAVPSRVIHSMLACRIVLHLRAQTVAESERGYTENGGRLTLKEMQSGKISEMLYAVPATIHDSLDTVTEVESRI